jgi:hypothetical protein
VRLKKDLAKQEELFDAELNFIEQKHFTGNKKMNIQNNRKSTLTYGAETCTSQQKHKLLATEMDCWRR